MGTLLEKLRHISLQKLPQTNDCHPPLPADLDGREFSVLNYFPHLLAGAFEQVCNLLDSQDLAHAHGSLLRSAEREPSGGLPFFGSL